jgi:hypothetical protein
MNSDTFSQNESSQSEDRRAGKYELLKAIGDELAFAQEELTYQQIRYYKKKILLHLEQSL